MVATIYNPANVVIAGSAQIRVAPVGTDVPTTFTSPTWDPAFIEMGFCDEKGLTVEDNKTMQPIKSMQQFYPILQINTDRKFSVKLNLQEWTKASVALAYGGGTWSTASGVSTYTPPNPSTVDTRALAVDWQSQGVNWRLVIPRVILSGAVTSTLARTSEALLPLEFDTLGSQTGAAWQLMTDNAAFA